MVTRSTNGVICSLIRKWPTNSCDCIVTVKPRVDHCLYGFPSGTEICERMATLGLQRNLVTYFTKKIHMTNPQAANTVSNFVGTLYLTPFVGGFVADGESASFLVVSRQVHRTSQAVFSAD